MDGTRNTKLITFSTMPTAAASVAHGLSVGPEIRFAKSHAASALLNYDQRRHDAYGLGKGGAQRRAHGAQMKNAHEQIIQRYINRAGHGDKAHGAFAVAYAAKNGADNIISRDKRNADKADGQIRCRAGYGGRRRGHSADDGPCQQQQRHRHDQRKPGKQRDCVAHGLGGLSLLPAAHGLANGNGGAHGQPHDHDGEHVHHLASDGNRRGARRAFKLADDKQIGHAVERLQKIRKQIGRRKEKNVFEYTALRQIPLHKKRPLAMRSALL